MPWLLVGALLALLLLQDRTASRERLALIRALQPERAAPAVQRSTEDAETRAIRAESMTREQMASKVREGLVREAQAMDIEWPTGALEVEVERILRTNSLLETPAV